MSYQIIQLHLRCSDSAKKKKKKKSFKRKKGRSCHFWHSHNKFASLETDKNKVFAGTQNKSDRTHSKRSRANVLDLKLGSTFFFLFKPEKGVVDFLLVNIKRTSLRGRQKPTCSCSPGLLIHHSQKGNRQL